MKTFYASLLLSACLPSFLFPQTISNSVKGFKPGVYFNTEEFIHNQPAESPQDCSKSLCFQVFDDFGFSNLKVKTEQSSNNIYPAGTIFGFVDCYGRAFRYSEGKYYQILDIGSVNIFVRMSNRSIDDTFIPESDYFFSSSLDGELQALERAKVIQSFAHFPEFSQAIDKNFYPNVSLKQFNPESGVYEINRAYNNLTALVSQR